MRLIIFINKYSVQHILYSSTSMSFTSLIISSFPSCLLMRMRFSQCIFLSVLSLWFYIIQEASFYTNTTS
nr:MAG TPA: hypothetical protein [Caudoviricetes sp.]